MVGIGTKSLTDSGWASCRQIVRLIRLAHASRSFHPASVLLSFQTIADLDCRIIDGGDAPTIPAVILHGYGASAGDLAPLAEPWIRSLGDDATAYRFVFPDAPNDLLSVGMPSGRAWWPLNMALLMEKVQTRRFADLHDQTPPGMDDARGQVERLIAELTASMNAPRYVLGGFSQGAMMSMDVAATASIEPPAALFLFSGTVVRRPGWIDGMPRLQNTRIVQSHGTLDPVLPYSSAVVLRDLMVEADLDVMFCPFEGGHSIGGDALSVTADALRSIAPVVDR